LHEALGNQTVQGLVVLGTLMLLCCVCRVCCGAAKRVVAEARARVTSTPPTAYQALDESDVPPTYHEQQQQQVQVQVQAEVEEARLAEFQDFLSEHQQFADLEDGEGTVEIARSAHEIGKITPEALRRARKAHPPTAHQTFDKSEAVPPPDHEVRLHLSRIGLRAALLHACVHRCTVSAAHPHPSAPLLTPPLNLNHLCAMTAMSHPCAA